jgi:hypothetical protein
MCAVSRSWVVDHTAVSIDRLATA